MSNHKKFAYVAVALLAVVFVTACLPADAAQAGITNPLQDVADIQGLIKKILSFLLTLVGLLALLAFVWGGIRYIISFGDEKKVAHAKQILLWATVGVGVVLLSYVMVYTVSSIFLGEF